MKEATAHPVSASAILGAILLGLVGCGKNGGTNGPWFQDEAAKAGIDFVHQSGHQKQGRFFMPEIMGGGGALFDMDGDGDLDAYLVQSGDVRLPPAEQPPTH